MPTPQYESGLDGLWAKNDALGYRCGDAEPSKDLSTPGSEALPIPVPASASPVALKK
jgi:hypothetical protein